jgi:chemotaxis protein histidine kinase CheA
MENIIKLKSEDYFVEIENELIEISNQCFEGELSNLDALIKMRKAKEKAETILVTVKTFEDERINEISNEAEQYKGSYCGFEIKAVNGRKSFIFKGISEIEEKETEKKQLEEKYKSAFEGFQKGTVQTVVEDEVRYWIDDSGELKPFPELTIGKSYLTVKQKPIKK